MTTQASRRGFIQTAMAAAMASCAPVIAAGAAGDSASFMKERRERTLRFIESMRMKDAPYGQFRYADGMPKATVYSSTYAAMTRSLYRDLDSLTPAQRQEWIAYLQSHQDDDGLFRDPLIFGEGWYKNDPDWCGRRHLSCHVVTALTCLGAVAAKPQVWLEPFYDKAALVAWLEARDWSKVDFVGNEVLNVGTLLQYARDFQKEPRAGAAMRVMLEWLAGHHVDPKSGLWGDYDLSQGPGLSRGVMGAYHFWLLFFYDRVPVPQPAAAIDHVLRTQGGKDEGFGQGVHGPLSSACEDIDSIDPLSRLIGGSSRRADIQKALLRAEPHVWQQQNDDGGFTWIRGAAFAYGHPLLSAGKDASGMFPTWFRTLSLAYLGRALPQSQAGGFDWHFSNCPGIQFFFA